MNGEALPWPELSRDPVGYWHRLRIEWHGGTEAKHKGRMLRAQVRRLKAEERLLRHFSKRLDA